MHVHVLGQEGEAKVWMEPEIEVQPTVASAIRRSALRSS
jgi:hypothetical protein